MEQNNNVTPLVNMIVADIRDIIHEKLSAAMASEKMTEDKSNDKPQRYIYGIKGIEELFHVSHRTAQEYKNTFLQPAVLQNGKKIMIPVDQALELFNQNQRKHE